jgi:DNA helicase HerA-like ATPase
LRIGGAVAGGAVVDIPITSFTRHGLIAGATGTGKTVTMQTLAEGLSTAGVPVLVADVKGDVSGLATAGPVEFLSLGGIGPGVPVRATVSDFGPQLLAKVLEANETQEQSLALVFHYADQRGLALVDLADLRALLTFLENHPDELEGIGGLAKATVGVLLRALVGLETGGGTELFGEPQFEISDLLRVGPDGRGMISCVELAAVQEHPELWSTALMWLVAELFESLPEAGDLPAPKLVVFLDEAHLLFDEATDGFVEQIERTVRLIRSKGVGVWFVTQVPGDVAESVLAQLGSRVQHALRAFTPKDAKALREAVSTFPTTPGLDLEELLPALAIGEAAVTVLDEKGVPTPVVHARIDAPKGRMGPADGFAPTHPDSPLMAKYGTRLEAESAREALAQRLPEPAIEPPPELPRPRRRARRRAADPVQTLEREIIRGVFGMLRKRL